LACTALALCLLHSAAGSPDSRLLRGAANDTSTSLSRGNVSDEVAAVGTGEMLPREDIDLEADFVGTIIDPIATWLAARKALIRKAITTYKGIYDSLTDEILQAVWQPLKWSSSFKNEMGSWGLPLTVGVVNDSPWPVRIIKHEVLKGTEFSSHSEGHKLRPGEEGKWEAYTKDWFGEVRIAIHLEVEDSARTQYTVQAASFKTPDLFCDTPRGNVFVGTWSDVWAEQEKLCRNPTGVLTNDRYYMAFFLADVVAQHV